MSRRGVDEAGADIIGDVIALEKRYLELIKRIKTRERMRADQVPQRTLLNVLDTLVPGYASLFENILRKLVRQKIPVAPTCPIASWSVGDLIEPIRNL